MKNRICGPLSIVAAMLLLLSGCETVDNNLRVLFDSVFSSSSNEVDRSGRRTQIESTHGSASRADLEALLDQGPEGVELSSEERTLYDKIMDYRQENDLPSIPVSRSLTFVAQVHARDTAATDFPDGCNRHSWSDDGPWQGGCYTSDHANAEIMWEKPKELTDYPGIGFEISHYNSAGTTARSSLNGWQSSPGHDRLIRNAGQWSSEEWQAIGIGVFETEAHVWFGREADPLEW